MTTPEPRDKRGAPRDLRRAISRQAWLTQRARNALRRPTFIGAISFATFATAVLSLIVVPRAQRQAAVPLPTVARPDTLSVAANAALARARLLEADSALGAARTEAQAEAARIEAEMARALAADTAAQARRDSLAIHLNALQGMIARTEQAPLASSYRALAELQVLRTDTRVSALVDSLSEIEREREGFGAVGGVDPIFVALTSRANDIGRTILGIAGQRRDALQAEIDRIDAPAVVVAEAPPVDTLRFITFRDSARVTMDSSMRELARLRGVVRTLDAEEREARRKATEVAPLVALVAAALVLSAVFGFGAAFFAELRTPRVSTAGELERFLGARVLATIETPRANAERRRRRSDQAAPPHLDPTAEGYQLAYLALATEHPALLTVTVTGDDPLVSAVVGSNLAAVAAEEARNTLLIDLDPARLATAAMRVRVTPGLGDIARGETSWPDSIVPAKVGRDRSVDFLPLGAGAPDPSSLLALLKDNVVRLSRYYDAIVAVAGLAGSESGLPGALPSGDVIFCAQPGLTPLRALRDQLERIRAAGGAIRGIVLWSAERPRLPAAPAAMSARRSAESREHATLG